MDDRKPDGRYVLTPLGATSPLARRLARIQEERDLSSAEMAARLGIHESTWSRIRKGVRPVSLSLIRRSVKAFPETSASVLEELRAQ